MPSSDWSGRDLAQRAEDVLDALSAIDSFIGGMAKERFLDDRKTQSAVERELLTIGEACAKILAVDETVETRFPGVPWRSIRGMANILRHEYGRVDPEVVWVTITGPDLRTLAEAIRAL